MTDREAVLDALQIAARHYDNEAGITSGWKRQFRAKASRLRRIARQLKKGA